MYHRIHKDNIDPWQLSVSPEHFEQQLRILKRYYNVIPLQDFVKQQQAQTLSKNSVCLTFDDGYADNYHHARPLLLKYNIPATFFIPSALINTKQSFWWDELTALILGSERLPARLTLRFPDEVLRVKIPASQRYAAYLSVWQRLQPLPYAEIQNMLQQIRVWAQLPAGTDQENYPMTTAQLDTLFSSSLFSPGIHTAHHLALNFETPEEQKNEITACLSFLAPYAKGQPLPIAYPFGSFNNYTLSISQELKLLAGFTTSPSLIHAESNPLTMGRFQAKDCDGAEFRRLLKAWICKPM